LGIFYYIWAMKKDLQEAYNNFKHLCDKHECNAKDRDTLNTNLLNFQNLINTLADEAEVVNEVNEEILP